MSDRTAALHMHTPSPRGVFAAANEPMANHLHLALSAVTEHLASVIAARVLAGLDARAEPPAAPAAAPPDFDELLTVAEAASEAKVTPATVREWVKAGKLRAGKAPYRIVRRDLRVLLASRLSNAVEAERDRLVALAVAPRRR